MQLARLSLNFSVTHLRGISILNSFLSPQVTLTMFINHTVAQLYSLLCTQYGVLETLLLDGTKLKCLAILDCISVKIWKTTATTLAPIMSVLLPGAIYNRSGAAIHNCHFSLV